MLPVHRLARQSAPQFAIALIAAGSWLSGCGDDPKPAGPSGSSGKGGSAGTAGTTGGSAGSVTAGTGGSTAGTGGAPVAGNAGSLAGGSAGSSGAGAGTGGQGGMGDGGMAGEDGTAGEGGAGTGGTAGTGGSSGSSGTAGTAGTDQGGQGGEGGSSSPLCLAADLDIEEVSSTPNQAHDHMPVTGANLTTLVAMINAGTPLTFALPTEGGTPHSHALTFTAGQLTVLRNGGALQMNVTSASTDPTGNNPHTHTYSVDCEP